MKHENRWGVLWVGLVVTAASSATLGCMGEVGDIDESALETSSDSLRGLGSSIAINEPAPYTFGESITVRVTGPIFPAGTCSRGPWISLYCYQGGVLVGTGSHAGFPEGWYYEWPFQLGPTQSWTSGAADCRLDVVYMSRSCRSSAVDSSVSFHVDP